MRIADANLVLRYLLEDLPEQFTISRNALEHDAIHIPFEVLAEVVYVLHGVYEVPNHDIAETLGSLLSYPNLSTTDQRVALSALQFFGQSNLDIVDALLLGRAVVRRDEVLTFDQKLSKMIASQESDTTGATGA